MDHVISLLYHASTEVLLHWPLGDVDVNLTLYVLSFSRGNKNIYLHFLSFLNIDMTQVVEILPQVRQGPTYST